jgi:hypothetical protein
VTLVCSSTDSPCVQVEVRENHVEIDNLARGGTSSQATPIVYLIPGYSNWWRICGKVVYVGGIRQCMKTFNVVFQAILEDHSGSILIYGFDNEAKRMSEVLKVGKEFVVEGRGGIKKIKVDWKVGNCEDEILILQETKFIEV